MCHQTCELQYYIRIKLKSKGETIVKLLDVFLASRVIYCTLMTTFARSVRFCWTVASRVAEKDWAATLYSI